jgi:hypothetical protein
MMLENFTLQREPGLRNPDFRPLRSPVPMLAIRHMVESDLLFMTRPRYTPKNVPRSCGRISSPGRS